MDALRVTKVCLGDSSTLQSTDRGLQVEGVLCTKGGSTSSGTLHLTAHHAIFHYDEEGREEMWVSPKPIPRRR